MRDEKEDDIGMKLSSNATNCERVIIDNIMNGSITIISSYVCQSADDAQIQITD